MLNEELKSQVLEKRQFETRKESILKKRFWQFLTIGFQTREYNFQFIKANTPPKVRFFQPRPWWKDSRLQLWEKIDFESRDKSVLISTLTFTEYQDTNTSNIFNLPKTEYSTRKKNEIVTLNQ